MARQGHRRKRSRSSATINAIDPAVASALNHVLAELDSKTSAPISNRKRQATVSSTSHACSTDATLTQEDNRADEGNDKLLWDPTVPVPAQLVQQRDARIHEWCVLVQNWQRTSSYPPGLLPSFDVEVARHFQVQQLSTYFMDAAAGAKMNMFERWLIDAKIEERQRAAAAHNIILTSRHTDPVLAHAAAHFDASQRLVEELRGVGLARPDAHKIVRDLCRKTNAAVDALVAQHQTAQMQTPLKKGDRIQLERRDNSMFTLVYHRKRWKKPFCVKITAPHYHKLRDMFVALHPDLPLAKYGQATPSVHIFHLLVMVVLVRYSSLAGGQLLQDLRGGGMQGALHAEIFAVLRQRCGPQMPLLEGFASPLNAFWPAFCSAFADDLDWHFGAVGDFLDQSLSGGVCEANPPFTPGLVNVMVDRMEYNLELANNAKTALTYVVVIPTVATTPQPDVAVAKRLAAAPFQRLLQVCTVHFVLPAKQHGYIEGAQHLRTTRYKSSLFDTSVILLQSDTAREECDDDWKDGLEQDLRQAFGSLHEQETQQRQAQVEAAVI